MICNDNGNNSNVPSSLEDIIDVFCVYQSLTKVGVYSNLDKTFSFHQVTENQVREVIISLGYSKRASYRHIPKKIKKIKNKFKKPATCLKKNLNIKDSREEYDLQTDRAFKVFFLLLDQLLQKSDRAHFLQRSNGHIGQQP